MVIYSAFYSYNQCIMHVRLYVLINTYCATDYISLCCNNARGQRQVDEHRLLFRLLSACLVHRFSPRKNTDHTQGRPSVTSVVMRLVQGGEPIAIPLEPAEQSSNRIDKR